MRPREGRVLGGVCAGLAKRYGMTRVQARLLFILIGIVLPGSPIVFYPILWIVMPSE